MALPTLRTRILTVVFKQSLHTDNIYHTICFSNVFLSILLGFGSTFSAAEESIVPHTSLGHITKYEVSSQASPFSMHKIFSSGMFGKQFDLYMPPRGKLPELKLSNQDS